jgi:hypothetical protein
MTSAIADLEHPFATAIFDSDKGSKDLYRRSLSVIRQIFIAYLTNSDC